MRTIFKTITLNFVIVANYISGNKIKHGKYNTITAIIYLLNYEKLVFYLIIITF